MKKTYQDGVVITYDGYVAVNKRSQYNVETPTVIVSGNDSYSKNITFENTTGH